MKKAPNDEERLKKQLAKPADYKRTFNSEHGKRVLYDMMDTHFVIRSTYSPGSPESTAFKEGQRNVVLRILTVLDIDMEQMKKLIEESNNHVKDIS